MSLNGKEYAFADSLKGNVTLLFVFIASSEPDAQMNIAGFAISIPLVNEFFKAFTLGEAKPGDELVKNAVADSVQAK
jgi:hypothetical protein